MLRRYEVHITLNSPQVPRRRHAPVLPLEAVRCKSNQEPKEYRSPPLEDTLRSCNFILLLENYSSQHEDRCHKEPLSPGIRSRRLLPRTRKTPIPPQVPISSQSETTAPDSPPVKRNTTGPTLSACKLPHTYLKSDSATSARQPRAAVVGPRPRIHRTILPVKSAT